MIDLPIEVWDKIYGMKRQMEFNDLIAKMDRKLIFGGGMYMACGWGWDMTPFYRRVIYPVGYGDDNGVHMVFSWMPLGIFSYRVFMYNDVVTMY